MTVRGKVLWGEVGPLMRGGGSPYCLSILRNVARLCRLFMRVGGGGVEVEVG